MFFLLLFENKISQDHQSMEQPNEFTILCKLKHHALIVQGIFSNEEKRWNRHLLMMNRISRALIIAAVGIVHVSAICFVWKKLGISAFVIITVLGLLTPLLEYVSPISDIKTEIDRRQSHAHFSHYEWKKLHDTMANTHNDFVAGTLKSDAFKDQFYNIVGMNSDLMLKTGVPSV